MLIRTLIAPPPIPIESASKWKDYWDMAAHVGELVGLTSAGIWAYFNFIRSRTYYPRMELGVTGDIRAKDAQRFLVPRITLRNIGNSKSSLFRKAPGSGVYGNRSRH